VGLGVWVRYGGFLCPCPLCVGFSWCGGGGEGVILADFSLNAYPISIENKRRYIIHTYLLQNKFTSQVK
jgi:hypothetical protein